MRLLNLNSHYTVVFKSVRDKKAVETMALQAYPKNRQYMISAFERATQGKPFGYLLFDAKVSISISSNISTKLALTITVFYVLTYIISLKQPEQK